MRTIKEEFEQDLKEEFSFTAFMEDFGEKFERRALFDMFLRVGLGEVWAVVRDCTSHKRGDMDD